MYIRLRSSKEAYSVILISGHRSELGLGEDKRAEVFRLRCVLVPLVDVDDVEARLVAVHGIQYDLNAESARKRENERRALSKRMPEKF